MLAAREWLKILCLVFSSIQMCSPCKPRAGPNPTPILGGCIKSQGGKASDVINSVEKGDTYCIYKYAWTSGGSVDNAKEVKRGEYAKEYHYEEPIAYGMGSGDTVVKFDASCDASTPQKPNYAITQWFCLEWCEKNCIDLNKWSSNSNKYPFKQIGCEKTGLECADTVNCRCIDTSDTECSVTSMGMPKPTVQDMINLYNTTCLNCYYKRSNAICKWQDLVGGGDSIDSSSATNSKTSHDSHVHKQSSSSSSTTTITNTEKTSGIDSGAAQMENDDQQEQADSSQSKTQVMQWVGNNEALQTTISPPPTGSLDKRETTAIISTPESTATQDEKDTANDPKMKEAVQSAKDKRAARKAARAKYWQDLLDALAKFKGAKRAAFAAAMEKLKALKKSRKGLKGKARRANKNEQKKVMAELAGMLKGLRKDKNADLSDTADKKQKSIKAANAD